MIRAYELTCLCGECILHRIIFVLAPSYFRESQCLLSFCLDTKYISPCDTSELSYLRAFFSSPSFTPCSSAPVKASRQLITYHGGRIKVTSSGEVWVFTHPSDADKHHRFESSLSHQSSMGTGRGQRWAMTITFRILQEIGTNDEPIQVGYGSWRVFGYTCSGLHVTPMLLML
jgi:hypothetical protein